MLNSSNSREVSTWSRAGNPFCFEDQKGIPGGFTYQWCCDTEIYGPSGNKECWDKVFFNFDFCCRPAAPVPTSHPRCWSGILHNWHEVCCRGSEVFPGPRGTVECWERAARLDDTEALDALACCDFVHPTGGSSPRCLMEGTATTCSYPGVVDFRPPSLEDIFRSKNDRRFGKKDTGPWPPVLRALRPPHRRAAAAQAQARPHFLTLGVGPFANAAQRLQREAQALGVFGQVHAYTDFAFVSAAEERVWGDHLRAWREHGARIAGYGWWKPVLCWRHLSDPTLPLGSGLLVFSDAGSKLSPLSVPSWVELLAAMRYFDVMAVVESDFTERHFSKRHLLDRFEPSLVGTRAADEGQFITGLFVLRKTFATLRLLRAWEQLVAEVDLVDETVGHAEEMIHCYRQPRCGFLGAPAAAGYPLSSSTFVTHAGSHRQDELHPEEFDDETQPIHRQGA